MNEELVEATKDPQNATECDPTSSQREETPPQSAPPPQEAKRGESNEGFFEKAVEAPLLFEDPDQNSDPDHGASFTQSEAGELARMRDELSRLQNELALRDARLEQIGREFEEFNTLYPHTPLSSLQDSVWEDVQRGIPIAAAYALEQRRREHTARSAAISNMQNASRSAGALNPTKSDYYSPDEVRAMSQSEIRANYQKIIQSMQKWR